jgi:hypothetical protein
VGAKRPGVAAPSRHVAAPTGETKVPAERDDTALSASLERDVDSDEATQLEAIFEEPLHIDDDAIIEDADGADSRRR